MPRDTRITYEIREHLGVIGKRSSGWRRELNLVCWNGKEPPKYDIRDWDPDHEHMSRGITLFEDEMQMLFRLLQRHNNRRAVARAGDAVSGPREEMEGVETALSEAGEEISAPADLSVLDQAGQEAAVPF